MAHGQNGHREGDAPSTALPVASTHPQNQMRSAAPLRQFAMPLPALPVLAGLVAKAAGQMAVKWAPYYAAKYGVYVAMKEYGVGRTYRRLVREAKSAVQ